MKITSVTSKDKRGKEVKGILGLESNIKLPAFEKTAVDIIIPFHGRYEKVTKLIQSIFKVRSNPYLITLVDDCSPNSEFIGKLRSAPQVNCIRLDQQVGFGAALKAGFKATKQPWVVFMHSDCVAEDPAWMANLGRTIMELSDQNVKMVSARTNNPVCDDVRFIGQMNQKSEHVILQEGEMMPLYCAMCSRDLFEHIGGFIKEYPYAMYEDQELSYRMAAYGFKQAISGTSWVYHHGNATIVEVGQKVKGAMQEMALNYQRCVDDIKKCRAKK